jgi:hypothetical protein
MLKERYKYALMVLAILVCSVIYAVIWSSAPYTTNDSGGYTDISMDLEDWRLERLYDRTLGYPLLIRLISIERDPGISLFYIQLFLHMSGVILLVSFLRKMGVRWLFVWGAVIYLINPIAVAPTTYVLTETLTQFLLLVGCLLLITGSVERNRALVLVAAVCFAYVGIVRPTYQVIPLLVAIVLFLLTFILVSYRREFLQAIISIILFGFLFVGGMLVYNGFQFGYWRLTPLMGYNLSTRTFPALELLPDEHAVARDILIANRDATGIEKAIDPFGITRYIWPARVELWDELGINNHELSDYLVELNLLLIAKAPNIYLHEVSFAATHFWFPHQPDVPYFESQLAKTGFALFHFAVMGIFGIVTILMIGLLFAYLSSSKRVRRDLSLWMGRSAIQIAFMFLSISTVALTFLVTILFDIGEPRQRFPVDILIIGFTVVGMEGLLFVRQKIHAINTLAPLQDVHLLPSNSEFKNWHGSN